MLANLQVRPHRLSGTPSEASFYVSLNLAATALTTSCFHGHIGCSLRYQRSAGMTGSAADSFDDSALCYYASA